MISKWHETGLGCGMTRRTKQDAELSSAGLFEDLAQPSAEQVQQAQAEKAIKQGQGAPRLLQPNRSQIELRASDLESLLAQDHRARLVWGYVMHQDLSRLIQAIKARGSTAGRAAIDPHILFALWLYATLQGVGSGRELARLSQEHDAYRWICGGVSVNYHALNDFRSGNVELNPEVPEEDYFKFANKLNASGYFPSFHVYKQRMYADLVIHYRDGLIARQFVRWCRLYSSEMVSWLNRFQAEQAQTMKQTTGDSGPELFIFPWHQSQQPADASPVMLN